MGDVAPLLSFAVTHASRAAKLGFPRRKPLRRPTNARIVRQSTCDGSSGSLRASHGHAETEQPLPCKLGAALPCELWIHAWPSMLGENWRGCNIAEFGVKPSTHQPIEW